MFVAEAPGVVEEYGDGVLRRAHAVHHGDFFGGRRIGAVLEPVAGIARVQII